MYIILQIKDKQHTTIRKDFPNSTICDRDEFTTVIVSAGKSYSFPNHTIVTMKIEDEL